MIGKITGIQDMRGTDHVLIDVRGVGYIVVFVSDSLIVKRSTKSGGFLRRRYNRYLRIGCILAYQTPIQTHLRPLGA